MNKSQLKRKLDALRLEIHSVLCNELCLIKTYLDMIQTRNLTKKEIEEGHKAIDRVIKRIDGEFYRVIAELEKNST